jgi:uncharacterized delta-60 repeat protein
MTDRPNRSKLRRLGRREAVAILALLLSMLITAIAAAAGGHSGAPDASFGRGGRVVVPLPRATAPSRFGPIAAAAGGRLLVAYVNEPDRERWSTVIERREADGAPDPSFGKGGSVTVRGSVTALAEDPSGGVVYGGYGTFGRLQPNGAKDKAFDARAPRSLGNFGPATITFDAAARIVVGGSVSSGARYHAHQGEAAVMRFKPDGRRDRTFASGGVVYLGVASGYTGELGLLPDGSMLALGPAVMHVAADGTVLSSPEITLGEGQPALAVFPDGSFAIVSSQPSKPGCTVTRYDAGGSPDSAFAQAGVFSDPNLSECRIVTAPEGGLLIRGVLEAAGGGGTPRLLLLTAAGAPAAGFGSGGSVTVSAPAKVAAGGPVEIEGVAFTSGGRIVVAGGGGDAVLIGLAASGAVDAAFGTAGTVVQPTTLPSWTSPRAITAEPDGELVVTGLTDAGSTHRHPFWMRFTADGKLRRTPSGAPYASVPVVGTQLRPAGHGQLYSLVYDTGPSIAKFKVGGALVDRFGRHGLVRLPHGFKASSFVVDPDGGVAVFGAVQEGRRMAVYRLTAAGRPDGDFAHHGLATVRVAGATYVRALAGVVRPGGDVVIVGAADARLAVAELGPSGRLRRGFGRGGLLTCGCGGAYPSKVDAVFHRGYVYALTHWATAASEGTDLVKVNAAGRLDRSFAGRGYRPVRVGTSIELFVRGERLVVVGQRGHFSGPAQVRAFRLDGAVDRSFRSGATVVAGGHQGVARVSAALQPGGRLVVAGERRAKKEIEGSRLELLGLR